MREKLLADLTQPPVQSARKRPFEVVEDVETITGALHKPRFGFEDQANPNMPYKRKAKSTRKSKKTTRRSTTRVPTRQLTRAVKKVVLYQEETKFFEYQCANFLVTAASPFFAPINIPGGDTQTVLNLAQGTTRNTRNGNAVYSLGLSLKLVLSPTGVVAPGEMIRLVVIHDKQPNGAIFPITAVYDLNDPIPTPTRPNCCAPRAYDTRNRFKMLYNKLFTFPVGTSYPQAVDTYIPIKKKITYTGNLNTIGDLATDNIAIFFLRMSDSTSMITVEGMNIRHWFKDS